MPGAAIPGGTVMRVSSVSLEAEYVTYLHLEEGHIGRIDL